MNVNLDVQEMKLNPEKTTIPKRPVLKRQDRIYIEDGKVSVHKKKEHKLDSGELIIEYYIEKTNMTLKEYCNCIIDNEE